MIISISASSPSILKNFKFCHSVTVEGNHIYQFWVPELAFIEMWKQRSRSIGWGESAYVTCAGS